MSAGITGQEFVIKLNANQLTHLLVALRAQARALAESPDPEMGGDYEDLLILEGLIRQLEEVRDAQATA